ncbi:MAG: NAD(P)/FAD-dependent oxidoreductase [Alphaproteobacteria bacterium]|nr:NAD(P)/FAD-dependent oxidoreductase [Alphaproteobacteria bacterium]MCB9796544.1 NAD(P)/FAD-dependent oxidoreductase [Alphaproteobacteria bacterium]
MSERHQGRVAVIGAGVSGIASANVWKSCGYEVTVFEASERYGGQWTQAYPGVRLQNTAPQYQFSTFPWPFEPDRHPTGEQVLRYIEAAVERFGLDVRLGCPVASMQRAAEGWTLTLGDGSVEAFSYVVIATGQYPGGSKKRRPPFADREAFSGRVVTSINSLDELRGQRVAVVGFGKTALDFAAWSADVAAETTHVFRTPRWTIPDLLLGVDYTRPFFSRFGSDMMPSWVHSSAPQRLLHTALPGVVDLFWQGIAALFAYQYRRDARPQDAEARRRLEAIIPPSSQFLSDLRSASALAPEGYHAHVASGRIEAIQQPVLAFTERGLRLADGREVEADLVCVCCGNDAPTYPFLPEPYRGLLEGQEGGPPLYRHLIDPRLPDIGFAGYNHGFLHIALCEMGALWQVAAHRGDLTLPTAQEMLDSAQRVAAWKREHSAFEATYNLAVSTRFQQHLDVLMQDLGVSQWRMLPNLPAEIFARYDPTAYGGVVETYLADSARRRARGETLRVVAVDA